MIQAKEARFGNTFYHTNTICNPYMTLDFQLMKNEISHDGECYPELEGIPLTPEILEACGFEKHNKKLWIHPETMLFELFNKNIMGGYNFVGGRMHHNLFIATTKRLEYLHELQNAFALTGKELQLNQK